MKKMKLLSIRTSFITMMTCMIILQFNSNSYSDNADKSSVIVYETVNSRGFQNEYATLCTTDITIKVTPTPVVNEEEMSIISLSTDSNKKKEDYTYNWTTKRVNFRTEPNTDSDIIETLDKRIKVRKITSSSSWTKVKYEGKVGWIYSEYLRDTELPSLDFNDEEIDLLAKIVWLESRGEPDEGSAGVVIVVLNRILSPEFPDTICEVLSETNQFTSWKLVNTAKPTEREFEIIDEVLNGLWDGLLSDDTVYFSTSPRNDNITAHIGNHWFCEY